MKDVTQLREQLFQKERIGEKFKEIDVKYFDIAEGLPEEYAKILNAKIYDMKQGYAKILKDITFSNEHLQKQVAILDSINSNE